MVFIICFQAEDCILARLVTGVQTCALPISISLRVIIPKGNASIDPHRGVDDEFVSESEPGMLRS